MLQSLIVVLAFVVAMGALLKGLGWMRRERIARSVPDVRRSLRGVSLRVLTSGRVTLPNMNPARANRTQGDLLLAPDRFVVASARGKLLDIRSSGHRLASARCTGPSRLVIEGTTPSPTGPAGSYRIELVTPDAPQWVEALAPFVVEDPEFTSLPA